MFSPYMRLDVHHKAIAVLAEVALVQVSRVQVYTLLVLLHVTLEEGLVVAVLTFCQRLLSALVSDMIIKRLHRSVHLGAASAVIGILKHYFTKDILDLNRV